MCRLPCLALLTLPLGIGGCSTTVFGSLPTGTTDCDSAWPGRWEPLGTAEDPMKPQGLIEIAVEPLMVLRRVSANATPPVDAPPAAREE